MRRLLGIVLLVGSCHILLSEHVASFRLCDPGLGRGNELADHATTFATRRLETAINNFVKELESLRHFCAFFGIEDVCKSRAEAFLLQQRSDVAWYDDYPMEKEKRKRGSLEQIMSTFLWFIHKDVKETPPKSD